MKKLILTSLLATGFSFSAIATEPAKPAEAPHALTETKKEEHKKEEHKKEEHKGHTHHHKMTKEEKVAHKLKEAEDLMAKLTEEVKTLTDAEKAAAEVNLKHAQIELDATKNEHLKSHASSHILKAKNFLKKVPNKHHKK